MACKTRQVSAPHSLRQDPSPVKGNYLQYKIAFLFLFLLEDVNVLGLFRLIDCLNRISVFTNEELIPAISKHQWAAHL